MKKITSILVITIVLSLSLLVLSSFSFAKEVIVEKTSVPNFNSLITPLTEPSVNDLHGDVWFAFITIAVLGSYLALKK